MDPTEAIRQRASQLHLENVARGIDRCQPYAFACSEAERRGIEVQLVPKGDVRLHGGMALYDPDSVLIVHEDANDEFMNAFYVAHEIGHVECGGRDEQALTRECDPLRGAEDSPVGVERVVDYNRRARIEVQMDLFAREFLLPRSWIRNLHLEQALNATAITVLCKAPFPVVALQMLDALLLPPVSLKDQLTSEAKPLNDDQKRAANHRGVPFLLEAGPGTGKTQTLIARISSLLESGVHPEKILVLTFSNKAAGELSERISRCHPSAAPSIWVGTFHAFGLDLIRRFHDRLNLPKDVRLLDRTDALELLESEYPRLHLKYFKNLIDPSQPLNFVLNAISRACDEVINSTKYRELAEAMLETNATGDSRVAAEKCCEVATVFEAYERLKNESGCVDFGDLVSLPVSLCENCAEVRDYLQNIYQHVLVDEFQDVNRSSIRLLSGLTDNGKNLWVVGDTKQSIYRFRGASSFNVSRFGKDDFPGGIHDRLSINYRSVSEIRDSFVQFASGMQVIRGTNSRLESNRGVFGEMPQCRSVRSDDEEIAALAETILEMRNAENGFADQAVLCGGNDRLARIAKGLESLGIPLLYLGNIFERDEIKNLLCILSLLVDRRAMGLLRVTTMRGFEAGLSDVASMVEYLKDTPQNAMKWAIDLDSIPRLSSTGKKSLLCISKLLSGFSISSNPWDVLARVLLDRTRIAAEIATCNDSTSQARGIAIWQLMNFVRNQPRGRELPISRLLNRIRLLVLHSDERELRQFPSVAQNIDAVRLMTIHGSKGLEFNVVHIAGMTAASMPRSPGQSLSRVILPPDGMIEGAECSGAEASRNGVIEEQECLFFVALSRARDRLFIYHPTEGDSGRSRPPSPFIHRLGNTLVTRTYRPSTWPAAAKDNDPIPISIVGTPKFTDRQLGLFERCPRRFFYTHILGVGGRRIESAFMRFHVVLQQALDLIAEKGLWPISITDAESCLMEIWEQHELREHGYSQDFLKIASELLRFYCEACSGHQLLPSQSLTLQYANGTITVTPQLILRDSQGRTVIRRVSTGHSRSKDGDDRAAAAFHIAARNHALDCRVEFVYLSNEVVQRSELSDAKLRNRQASIIAMFEAIQSGDFPKVPEITCPRCPAYFICGSIPEGPLEKNFSE